MKKTLIYILVLMMALSAVSAYAQAPAVSQTEETVPQFDYTHLKVGTITPFEGSFFTRMWGNVASDLDVRALIHGYNLVEWNKDSGTFDVDPSVVSGIIVTENETGDRTYTLTLYNDLRYTDGTPITTADYAFSMLLQCAPQIAEIGGTIHPMDYLLGYQAYTSGQARYLAGMRIYSDRTLSITVSHEYLPFFYEMGLLDCTPYPIAQIAPGCQVRDDGNGVYLDGPFTADLLRSTILDPQTGYQSHPTVTSGPYHLVSFDGNTAEFEINPSYKGNSSGAKPGIQKLTYSVVKMDEVMEMLADGRLDMVNKCTTASVVQQGMQLVSQQGRLNMTNYARNGLSFIVFCCERNTVSSAAVRKAISSCVDKELLVSETVNNFGYPVDGFYGLGQWMYQIVNGTMAYPVKDIEENATNEDLAAHEKEQQDWEDLTLEHAVIYPLDVEAAVSLLNQDGWTLNEDGNAFDPAVDAVRCKLLDGQLVALDLSLLCSQESRKAEAIAHAMTDSLAQAGIRLTVQERPLSEVMNAYYRNDPRDCDMIFMASNFDEIFDPSLTFQPDGREINRYNPTAINDKTLYSLAVDMRKTDAADMLGYMTKWVAFQERFQDVAPMIPLYSSVYFDFYPRVLQQYDVMGTLGWSQAIVNAYMSDAPDEVAK